MLNKPKNRIWPSLSCRIWLNIRRQPVGEKNGNRPSITRTRASASQRSALSTVYFFAAAAGAPWPRNTLKNSDEDGSSTITSLFLAKLAL